MSFIWQPPRQESTATSQSQPVAPAPTTDTQQVSFAKKSIPRLIVAAIVINLIPSLFGLLGQEYRTTGESIRNYANIAIVISLLVIVFKQVTVRK